MSLRKYLIVKCIYKCNDRIHLKKQVVLKNFVVPSINFGIFGKSLTRVLVFQGCDSEISSMVTEAQRRVTECMNAALKTIGFLAAVSGTDLLLTEHGSEVIDNVGIFLVQ